MFEQNMESESALHLYLALRQASLDYSYLRSLLTKRIFGQQIAQIMLTKTNFAEIETNKVLDLLSDFSQNEKLMIKFREQFTKHL
jgi:hypothetical protein